MKSFTITATTLLSLSAAALGRPADSPAEVWTPHITSPTAETVWTIGQKYNVTWDTSNPPKVTNPFGLVVLRSGGDIQWNHMLAYGFKILDGTTQVTAPDVNAGDYSVVLMGDSDNWSPDFSIVSSASNSI